ncbi:MAG: glutathione S-transferase N-terminal domain-containing protein [Gammaproteobacteria bacterium]|nr:glutathione S-transferase N-terminal domain-containing protein [Gammaproteobacteria bacterium]
MRWLIRAFFRTLRLVLSPFMIVGEKLTTPKGMVRSPEAQQAVDTACKELVLYQFRTCPFCIKVRREIKRLSLNIELRDAQHDQQSRSELQQGGGEILVPCLRITEADGELHWMYESDHIIAYLRERFAA